MGEDARFEKSARLLLLARLLASSAEGLTLDEMAAGAGVQRRTVERMRDALWGLFPQMEAVDDPPTRRWRIPGGLDGLYQAPTAEEMAALRRAADSAGLIGLEASATALRGLERKVLSATKAAHRRRLAPDLEALIQAEAVALSPGPRPSEDPALLAVLREALIAGRGLRFRYEGGSTPGRGREVTPYGLLFGRANYLVAAEGEGEPRNWRLDLMSAVEMLDRAASPPADFSLQAYADRSFGIFHGEVEDVVLRFRPDAAKNALRWRFHSNQTAETAADGSVIVRFRASGMRELAWHLFTWGDAVEIVAPDGLRALLVEQLEAALAAHQTARLPTRGPE